MGKIALAKVAPEKLAQAAKLAATEHITHDEAERRHATRGPRARGALAWIRPWGRR